MFSTVSVLLPFFNAAGTLATAIDSITRQTFHDWELLLIDDGSTDEGLCLARDYALRDSRIRVMDCPHRGIVGALQHGCAAVASPYLARMDADDVAHPQRLEKQLALMLQDPEMALCGTRVTMTGDAIACGRRRYEAWINALVTHEDMIRELFVECPVPHPTFMLRRELFDSIGGYQDNGWAEDYDVCMRVFAAGLRFGKVAESLLDWTESPGRLSRVDNRYRPEQFRNLKRHYLFKTYWARERSFFQWGAGEIGKPWLREWSDQRPEAVIDIQPRRIGEYIHGYRVIPPDALPDDAFVVIAVGAPTARQEIRAWMTVRGFREGDNYLFLA